MAKKPTITKKQLNLLRQGVREKAKDNPTLLFDLSKILFKEQLNFVTNTSRYSVACCSRRSGKSVAIAAKLVESAIKYPKRKNLYITLSKTSAKGIIWGELKDMIVDHGIEAKVNNHELIITFWNGSEIHIGGAKDSQEIEKYRGWKFQMIVIDEAQSFKPFIKELINEILDPALGDYQGTMLMTGTPGPLLAGTFYEACHGLGDFKGWSQFHWTLKENVKFPAFVSGQTDYETYMAEVRARRGITEQDASYRREYLGVWAKDDSALVYNCPQAHRIEAVPTEVTDWRYILAYDTGYIDDDAFSVIAYSPTHFSAYVVESTALKRIDENGNIVERGFEESIEYIKHLNEIYNFTKIVFDPTEAGKKTAIEIRKRYGIKLDPAEKTNKVANIVMMNDDLRTGRLKIVESMCSELLFQYDNLTWDSRADGTRIPGTKIGGRKMDHNCDSALYGWRAAKHYMAKEAPTNFERGTPEYYKEQTEKMKDELVRKARMNNSQDKKKRKRSTF